MTFPDRRSIDNFALVGNDGWSYDDLQPYYRKFHTFHEPSDKIVEQLGLDYSDAALHGKSGPIHVSYGNYISNVSQVWNRTLKALDRKATADPLSGNALGAVNAPGTVNPAKYTRSSAAAGYLTEEVRTRENLRIVTEASVQSILLTKRGTETVVQGVRYQTKDGQEHEVHSDQVILCGGVFHSPQLLELSGIGDAQRLKNLDIECIVDLPGVGENLQDHSVIAVSFEATEPTLDSLLKDKAKLGAAFQEYKEHAKGPFTSANFNQAYLPCMDLISETGQNTLVHLLDEHAKDVPAERRKQFDLTRSIIEDPNQSSIQFLCAPVQAGPDQNSRPVSEEARKANYLTLYSSLSHPFSRGTVHAASRDISSPPLIDPRYFSSPLDREIVTRHLQYLPQICATPPLSNLIKRDGLTIPADLNLSDAEYAKKLLETGFTSYHPCGTCAMLPRESGGVVDARLQVYGVRGLRVVDASVFPMIPRGNIQSSVYAVAEKAADVIKGEFKGK
jgi:choline dehydrogenase-like flavoprotein